MNIIIPAKKSINMGSTPLAARNMRKNIYTAPSKNMVSSILLSNPMSCFHFLTEVFPL
jgi:hypothetical protein